MCFKFSTPGKVVNDPMVAACYECVDAQAKYTERNYRNT